MLRGCGILRCLGVYRSLGSGFCRKCLEVSGFRATGGGGGGLSVFAQVDIMKVLNKGPEGRGVL